MSIRATCLPNCARRSATASWHHPLRDDAYGEAAECVRRRKDLEAVIAGQMGRYRELSLPEKIGLIETSVIVRQAQRPGRCFCDEPVVERNRQWQQARPAQLAVRLVAQRFDRGLSCRTGYLYAV